MPTSQQILKEVERICDSEQFKQSKRLQNFLRYIVTEALEGRGPRIKSTTINIDVFKRNTVDDTVVRTTAVRLRSALDNYNAINDCEIIITIPKGGYIPSFSQKSDMRHLVVLTNLSEKPFRAATKFKVVISVIILIMVIGLSYLLLPPTAAVPSEDKIHMFILSDRNDAPERTSNIFFQKLVQDLVLLDGADIVDLTKKSEASTIIHDKIQNNSSAIFLILTCSIQYKENKLKVIWRLIDARSSIILWMGEGATVNTDDKSAEQLGSNIAYNIMGVDGAMNVQFERFSGLKTISLKCIPQSRRIAIIFDEFYQKEIIQCLEMIVKRSPNQATAWGLLAQLYSYTGELQASKGNDPKPWKLKLIHATNIAETLAPELYTTQQAKLFTDFSLGQMDKFYAVAHKLLAKYHGDPTLKIRIGSRFVRLGNFAEGKKLILEGITQKNTNNPWDYVNLVFAYFADGTYEELLTAANRSADTHTYLLPLFKAARLAELNRIDEARLQVNELLNLKPGYENYVLIDAEGRGISKTLTERLLNGLKKAGLNVSH